MQFRTIAAIAALAVSARAQTVAPDVQASVLLVLAQAIPTELASYALASSSAFAAEMASSLSVGNTPTWYQALPSDVKSLLPQIYPEQVEATPTPVTSSSAYVVASSSSSGSSSSGSSSSGSSSKAMVTPYPTGANGTSVAPTMSAPGTVSMPESASTSASGPQFTGAAARLPNAAVGAGVGAALGFLGMLAL